MEGRIAAQPCVRIFRSRVLLLFRQEPPARTLPLHLVHSRPRALRMGPSHLQPIYTPRGTGLSVLHLHMGRVLQAPAPVLGSWAWERIFVLRSVRHRDDIPHSHHEARESCKARDRALLLLLVVGAGFEI